MRAVLIAVMSAACSWGAYSPVVPPAPPETDQATPGTPDPDTAAQAIAASIAHANRPAEDRQRDADRRPDQILAFLGVQPGDSVADLMAGRGYYTELLARAVGPEGRVYTQNNAYVVERFAGEALTERLARPGLERVVRLDRELEDPGLPEAQLDAVFMGLFYHDSVWMGTDRDAMNEAILAALEPGGVFVVTDHHAAAGHGVQDVKSLHRIERMVVQRELEAAGFVFDGESEALRQPDDDRTANVFDEAIRGRTDRFVLRFKKPETP